MTVIPPTATLMSGIPTEEPVAAVTSAPTAEPAVVPTSSPPSTVKALPKSETVVPAIVVTVETDSAVGGAGTKTRTPTFLVVNTPEGSDQSSAPDLAGVASPTKTVTSASEVADVAVLEVQETSVPEATPSPVKLLASTKAVSTSAEPEKPLPTVIMRLASTVESADVTPTPEWTWRGVEVERKPGGATGASSTVLAVRVFGVLDREVVVREASSGLSTKLVTGRRPQYGDYADDVTGLPAAIYVISPEGIDAPLEVGLEPGDFVLVEFALRPPLEPTGTLQTPEPTAVSVTKGTPVVQQEMTAMPTAKPAVVSTVALDDATAMPATAEPVRGQIVADPAATESAKAGWTWQGVVYEQRTTTGSPTGTIAVRIVEVPERKVLVEELSGTWETTLITGRKPEYGRFSDDVGGLGPGTYRIAPVDIEADVTVNLAQGDFVLVEFALRPAPVGRRNPLR